MRTRLPDGGASFGRSTILQRSRPRLSSFSIDRGASATRSHGLRLTHRKEMTCWPVNPRVGNVKNNDPSLIEPMSVQ